MRVLVIGFPLPNPRFDNYTVLNSPSWYDYDAVIVEPESISSIIEAVVNRRDDHTTRADEPVLNQPTSALNVGLADAIRRRRAEATKLLANGGVIAVFAKPEVVHEGVAGFSGCDRYAFLPAPAGVSYDIPFMLRADGNEVRPADEAHPFAPVIERYRSWFAYRVRFDDSAQGFPGYGKVIARSIGGAAVSIELKVGDGKIVFLPALGSMAFGEQRFELASALLEALRLSRGETSEETPAWASTFALPGTAEAESEEREARESLAAAQARHDEARAKVAEATKYRGLLWQTGTVHLEPLVRDVFRTIGFEVEPDPDKPGWIRDGNVTALFEVEGSIDPVVEVPYFRLQKRLEQDLFKTKEPKKGLIVVNGQRLQPPRERTQPFSDTLRIAAENYRFGLVSTGRLYDAIRAVLEEPYDTVRRSVIRSNLLTAVGEVGSDLLPPVAAAQDDPLPEQPEAE
ncbi:MAG: hypothetical protein ACYDCQ_06275 [Dehalococcoidia bacterium]